MLALAQYRSELCPVCGSHKSICQGMGAENSFEAQLPTRCHASTAIRRAQHDAEYEYPEALVWAAGRKTDHT